MDDYKEYEKKRDNNIKRNNKYLDEFQKWLIGKGLKTKTINSHTSNADLYINEFLNYYDVCKMEDGINELNDFFDDWFVRKCLWSTASSTKSTAASIKKFYNCMQELGHITKEDYAFVCNVIKEEMDNWIYTVEDYNNFTDFDF